MMDGLLSSFLQLCNGFEIFLRRVLKDADPKTLEPKYAIRAYVLEKKDKGEIFEITEKGDFKIVDGKVVKV